MEHTPRTNEPRDLLEAVFKEAVEAVRPDRLLAEGAWIRTCARPLEAYARVLFVAMGKGALAFAHAVESQLGDRIDDGVAVVPHGYRTRAPFVQAPSSRIRVLEAGHPVPDRDGVLASRVVLGLAREANREDLVVACVSGGGSALLPAPPDAIPLEAIGNLTRRLLLSGAPIAEINTVRRALSDIAGGGLASAASPAEVIGLVLSDVPGDDPAVVAGGPVSPSPTTSEDALEVLARYRIRPHVRVLEHLSEARYPGGSAAAVLLVGTNADLLKAAAAVASRHGIEARVYREPLTGEARRAGTDLARRMGGDGRLHVLGGESTVRVRGRGMGGRNQELALAAAIELERSGRQVTLLAAGSDGIDGPTTAAGAVCDAGTVAEGRRLGLDATLHLDRNDSWSYFDRVGGHVVTGPTHTNVMDLVLVL